MSSRFISAGSIDATTGTPASSETLSPQPSEPVNRKSKEWQQVTEQLEADRQRRLQQARQAQEGGEKSLYEVLQANKAAKQAEIEEKTKLKNQFRALDEDEIDFLDEVKRKKREEELERRRELEEGLKAFKEKKGRGEEDEEEEGEGMGEGEEEGWAFTADTGRRRKRRGPGPGGRKLLVKKARRESTEDGRQEGEKKEGEETTTAEVKAAATSPPKPEAAPAAEVKKPSGGLLVDYGSDSDD
ncbi:putative NEFA-interacting nuclear protein NIP30 [Triangularia setosa]|uniref:NEFA-interacting nuclear protein NIP30 n=1 Tax=Triangularia setosa TaxID=2587417 RepID=A0AAN6W0K7_9PEZI|nr:putative NEFA-interacting nuclear protein NIP30 [Podospora setosa]